MIARDITAVIPLYNKAHTIMLALESIWNQTCPPAQVIVVDDGSTDGGYERVASLNRSDLRLVRQDNAGPGAARNHGLSLAQTRYVAFLDADDIWLPNHVETLCSLVEACPGQPLYANRLGILGEPVPDPQEPTEFSIIENYPVRWLEGLVVSTCAAMVDRQAALEIGGFGTDNNRGEDLALWLKLTLGRSMVMGSRTGALYRREASDLTSRPSEGPDAAMLWIDRTLPLQDTVSPEQRQRLGDFRTRLALLHAAEWIRFGGRDKARTFLALAAGKESDRTLYRLLMLLTGPLWPLRRVVIALRRLLPKRG